MIVALVALRAWRIPAGVRMRWPFSPAWSIVAAVGMLFSGFVAGGIALNIAGITATEGSLASGVVAGVGEFVGEILLFLLLVSTQRTAAPSGHTVEPMPQWRVGSAIGFGVLVLAVTWFPIQTLGSLVASAQAWLGGPLPPPTGHSALESLGAPGHAAMKIAFVVHAALLAPIAEELIFRGAIQQALRGLGIAPMGAILLSSALFAGVHIGVLTDGAVASGIVMLFALGAVLGWLAERTGRIAASVAAHAAFNALNLAIFFAGLP